jgi:phage-related protein
MADQKELVWVGSSKKDLQDFPKEVRAAFGVALFWAQKGGKHPQAKPLKGFKGGGIVEIVEDFDTDTYRCVYTVKFGKKVYVLHAFQKKSKKGIETPKQDIDLIKERIKLVKEREEVKS